MGVTRVTQEISRLGPNSSGIILGNWFERLSVMSFQGRSDVASTVDHLQDSIDRHHGVWKRLVKTTEV